ncbi:MAG TPA: 4Fe-4S binding protein [Candidatus Dormibacteraeota bacterium]|nr:4Fe-4S binding protein [Candidatus Dormibacteraeota bacterium]
MGAESPFRFPPPEFESGHQLPLTAVPGGRAWIWEYIDVAVLLAALGIATWLIYKKRSRKGILALSIFSVLYFGFWRKGCVCSIGSLQNVALGVCDSSYGLPIGVLAFFVLPLIFALFAGRSFCAAVCPHGALQDLVLLRPIRLAPWLEQGLSVVPYFYMGAGVLFAATGSGFIICQYDPFITVFRMNGPVLMVTAGIVLLLLGTFVGRPYCRFLCPYGALLKLGSVFSRWRVRVTPTFCTQCRLCEASCPFGALNHPSSANPTDIRPERRRLVWTLVLVPVAVIVGGCLGFLASPAASRMHPTVQLAELFLKKGNAPVAYGPLTPEAFALERARRDPKQVLMEAALVQKRFQTATPLFGGWIGLVVALKLVGLALHRQSTDYEPDRGNCFSCARCFEYCPNETGARAFLETSVKPSAPLQPSAPS